MREHRGPMLGEIRRRTSTGVLTALTRNGTDEDIPPLVLMHGAMADAHAWSGVVDGLDPRRSLLLPNRRGRAPSAPVDRDYSVDREVEDLLGWLTHLPQPVDVAGHSYGGLIATEAARRGADVRAMVLYEPVVRPFGSDQILELADAIDGGDLDRAVEIVNIDISGYTWDHVESLRPTRAWAQLRDLAVPLAAELRAVADFDLVASAAGWPGPSVTLIAGQQSRHRPPYGPAIEAFCQALGIDTVVLLPGQDHLAHITAPQLLATTIEAALPT